MNVDVGMTIVDRIVSSQHIVVYIGQTVADNDFWYRPQGLVLEDKFNQPTFSNAVTGDSLASVSAPLQSCVG